MSTIAQEITKNSLLLKTIQKVFKGSEAKKLENDLHSMVQKAFDLKKVIEADSLDAVVLPRQFSLRERQILFMLEKGWKNREMAKALNNNEKSVSTYVRRIRVKLNVPFDSSVYTVVKTALALGVVPDEMPQPKVKKTKS